MKNILLNKILHIGGGQKSLLFTRKEGWLLFSNVNSSKNGGGRHLISAISCGGVILCK